MIESDDSKMAALVLAQGALVAALEYHNQSCPHCDDGIEEYSCVCMSGPDPEKVCELCEEALAAIQVAIGRVG